jgi:hypothetical protein
LAPLHFYGTKHSFVWKIFVLIGRFGVLIIFLGFWVEPANSAPSGSPHTNFWLLYNFKVLNILLFEIFLMFLGWACKLCRIEPICIFVCFFFTFEALNILQESPYKIVNRKSSCGYATYFFFHDYFFFCLLRILKTSKREFFYLSPRVVSILKHFYVITNSFQCVLKILFLIDDALNWLEMSKMPLLSISKWKQGYYPKLKYACFLRFECNI